MPGLKALFHGLIEPAHLLRACVQHTRMCGGAAVDLFPRYSLVYILLTSSGARMHGLYSYTHCTSAGTAIT